MKITSITTRYASAEDRILLTVADAEGATLKLLLTRRLTRQLIPALVVGLEAQLRAPENAPPQAIEAAQVYAQLHARLSRKPAAPVVAMERTAAYLVDEVRVRGGRTAGKTLLFYAADLAEPPELTLSATELRQWLELLRRAVDAGDWGLDVFPAWFV